MQFLDPIFLTGLLAAGIPILLHFLQRRKAIRVQFAPLRFLRPTHQKQMQRMNLHRLLLLLLRVAIIVMVVLALARPTLTGGLPNLMAGEGGSSIVVLLDRSASMSAQMTRGTVFDRGREVVGELLEDFDSADEVDVLLFDEETTPLFSEFVRSPSLVLEELGDVGARPRGTDYVSAVEGALDLLSRGRQNHREIFLVGDLQRAELDSTRLGRLQQRLAGEAAANLYLRPVRPEPFVNRSVEEVRPPATLLRRGETAEVAVSVRQDGGEALDEALFLQVDDTTVGETEVRVPPEGEGRHVFPLTLPEAADLGATVRIRPDRYALDDERHLVLSVSEQVPVLLLRGLLTEEGERDPVLFLNAALDPRGDGSGSFAVDIEPSSSFDVESLPTYPVVVGSNVRELGAARLAALEDYLEGGGTLLLFVGDPRVGSYVNERLLPRWTSLRLGAYRGEEQAFERLELAAAGHPIFEDIEAEALETLTEARLQSFYRIEESEGETLLRFAGGGGAVVEFGVGEGRVILAGFDTSAVAGDLPWSPMFLPLVQRMSAYLATTGWGRDASQFSVGQPISLEVPGASRGARDWTVLLPDGTRAPATLDASRLPARVVFEDAGRPGIYTFAADGEDVAHVAVNPPRSESRRQFWEAEELQRLLSSGDQVAVRVLEGEDLRESLREARQGTPIHQWFLLAAFLLMLVEGIVSRRVSAKAASGGEAAGSA